MWFWVCVLKSSVCNWNQQRSIHVESERWETKLRAFTPTHGYWIFFEKFATYKRGRLRLVSLMRKTRSYLKGTEFQENNISQLLLLNILPVISLLHSACRQFTNRGNRQTAADWWKCWSNTLCARFYWISMTDLNHMVKLCDSTRILSPCTRRKPCNKSIRRGFDESKKSFSKCRRRGNYVIPTII